MKKLILILLLVPLVSWGWTPWNAPRKNANETITGDWTFYDVIFSDSAVFNGLAIFNLVEIDSLVFNYINTDSVLVNNIFISNGETFLGDALSDTVDIKGIVLLPDEGKMFFNTPLETYFYTNDEDSVSFTLNNRRLWEITPLKWTFAPDAGADTTFSIVLPRCNDITTPTFMFVDSSGFRLVTRGRLGFSVNGISTGLQVHQYGTSFGANSAGTGEIIKDVGSTTNVIYTFNSDANTGYTREGNDSLALMAGGVEGISIREGAGTGSIIIGLNGDVKVLGTTDVPYLTADSMALTVGNKFYLDGNGGNTYLTCKGATPDSVELYIDGNATPYFRLTALNHRLRTNLTLGGFTTADTLERLILPVWRASGNATPVLDFGDSTGFNLQANDLLEFVSNGVLRIRFGNSSIATYLNGSATDGAIIQWGSSLSSTYPNYSWSGDINTGWGKAGLDSLSGIVGGYEAWRIAEGIGGVAGAVRSRLMGTLCFNSLHTLAVGDSVLFNMYPSNVDTSFKYYDNVVWRTLVTDNSYCYNIDGDGLIITAGVLSVPLDATGGLETVDDSINVKLDGVTLSLSASGLKADTSTYLATKYDNSLKVDSADIGTLAKLNTFLSVTLKDSAKLDTKAEFSALFSADVPVFKSDSTTTFATPTQASGYVTGGTLAGLFTSVTAKEETGLPGSPAEGMIAVKTDCTFIYLNSVWRYVPVVARPTP